MTAESSGNPGQLAFFIFSAGQNHSQVSVSIAQNSSEFSDPDHPAMLLETCKQAHRHAIKRTGQSYMKPVCVVTEEGHVLADATTLGLLTLAQNRLTEPQTPPALLPPPERPRNEPVSALFLFTTGEFHENTLSVLAPWSESFVDREDPEILLKTCADALHAAESRRMDPDIPARFLAMLDSNGRVITTPWHLGLVGLTAIQIAGTQPCALEMETA